MTWICLDRLLLDEHAAPLFLAPALNHATLRERALLPPARDAHPEQTRKPPAQG